MFNDRVGGGVESRSPPSPFKTTAQVRLNYAVEI